MTEASAKRPKIEKSGYPKLFEGIRKELPLRGAYNFDSAVSATIRRLDSESEFATPELVRVLVCAGVPRDDFYNPERARAWAAVGQVLAIMAHAGLPGGPKRIGEVLSEIELSDNRLARLLTARGQAFREQAVRTVRLVAGAGNPANLDDLLELMLVEHLPGQDEWAESLRLRIVESFERAAQAQEKVVPSAG